MRPCPSSLLLLTVVAATACPAYPARAAVVAADPLKPLARWLGAWRWDGKDEHDQPLQSLSTVSLEAGGGCIVDRTEDIEKGQAVPAALNVYYWRPEAKALAAAGFNAQGGHGWSVIYIRGKNWIEHGSDYDLETKLRTHIDRWDWRTDDEVSFQGTHIFRAGVAEPDDPVLTARRLPPGSAPLGKPAPAQPLVDRLAPLARLVGNWRIETASSQARSAVGRAAVEIDPSGAFLIERWSASTTTNAPAALRIYYWQPETKSIATVDFQSSGAHGQSVLSLAGDKWVAHQSGFSAGGKPYSHIRIYHWSQGEVLEVEDSDPVELGETHPGQRYTWKRSG